MFAGLLGLSLFTASLEAASVLMVLPLGASLLDAGPLVKWCLVLAALVGLRSAAFMAHARLLARESGGAIHEAKAAVLRAYASAPDAAMVELRGGRLAQVYFRGSHSSGIIVLRQLQLSAEATRTAVLASLLLWLNVRLSAGLVAAGAVLWLAFNRAFAQRTYDEGLKRFEAETRQTQLLYEFARGARQINLAGAMEPWLERFSRSSQAFSRHYAAEMTLQCLPKVWFELGAAAVILAWALVAMSQGPERAAINLPLLATVVVGAGKLMSSLSSPGRYRLDILGALANAEAFEEFIESIRRPAPGRGRRCEGGLGLKLEGVRFSYPDRADLLKGVDLEISEGRCVVIAGPFGSGKTTLLELLLGLHEPSAGRILLNGQPLRDYDRASWLERVGVVPQDGFLFHATVAENILLGRVGHAREAVERAAELVGARDFIASLDRGYETVVGERGLRLSGGQRQLILLARAMLTDPRLLVLDEPASGLDPLAQAKLALLLRRISASRTVVVATHQPDWAAWADAAFVLKDGELCAVGR